MNNTASSTLPPRTTFTCWPGGHSRAATLSFDDGRSEDRMLVDMLNRHGLKATFNLNSTFLGRPDRVSPDELTTLYAGHEIGVHTLTHPHLTQLSDEAVLREVADDRRALEQMTGVIMRGMGYPFSDFDDRVKRLVAAAGLRYARTNRQTPDFSLPADWLAWHPTGHEKIADEAMFTRFFDEPRWPQLRLLHLYGHSFEFAEADRLKKFETTCALMSEARSQVWFATNAEVHDYCDSMRRLRFSADGWLIENPSAMDVWIRVDGAPVCLPGGSTRRVTGQR
jgi:peptidoglycan-N-acetylglucosamine deacetylase